MLITYKTQNSKMHVEPIAGVLNRQIDRQTDRQTDRHIDRQIDRFQYTNTKHGIKQHMMQYKKNSNKIKHI